MSHSTVLKQLVPLELGGEFEADLELEGQQLDAVQARAEDLLLEIFPDTADELLPNWERVCGITDAEGKPIQARRDAVVAQLNAIGPASRQDYIDLAANLGYTITIAELSPPKAGIAKAGVAKVWPDEIRFVWQVTMSEQHLFDAKAGIAKAGFKIRWKDTVTPLETMLQLLKPAHTEISFYYS